MKALLKNECIRMFRGIDFKVSLLLGCGIAVWHFWQNILNQDMQLMEVPQNVYVSWIGASSYWMQSYWYFLILPLLAAIPFAGTFYSDLKNGYMKSVVLRCGRRNYFMGKGAVVFLSGGISVVVPLVLNFILTAMFRPMTLPDPLISIGPLTYQIGSSLYYLHPLLYTILYMVFDFFAGGILALSAAVFCYAANYKFIALLMPYIIYYLLFCLGGIFHTNAYSPNYFLIPGMGIESVNSIILVAVVTIIVVTVYVWKGKRYEA